MCIFLAESTESTTLFTESTTLFTESTTTFTETTTIFTESTTLFTESTTLFTQVSAYAATPGVSAAHAQGLTGEVTFSVW